METEIDLETRVTDMIHEIGIPAHIKGYHYLRDAIMMAVEDMDVLNAVTKVLFPHGSLSSDKALPPSDTALS